jgi:hypothetical protein
MDPKRGQRHPAGFENLRIWVLVLPSMKAQIGGYMDQQLPTQLLPAVQHFGFSVFNIGIPNLIMWGLVVVLFVAGGWSRLPRLFERPERAEPKEGRQA